MDMKTGTRLAKLLDTAGFVGLGGFHPGPDDAVPECDGVPAQTLILVGSAGPDLFEVFAESPEYSDGRPDPLDRHCRRVLAPVAGEFGFNVILPFEGPPYHPFQRWAMRCGRFSRSPMGLLAHSEYGPWVALRAAFLSVERVGNFAYRTAPGPCEACADKPCMPACPAKALTDARYDVALCRSHLAAPDVECRSGCLARRACPIGSRYAHSPAQGAFHMRAFIG